ncbi:MAG: peptidase [Rikenellaceae bacterium]|nr:peptidase [Rikenellaceae bacterium]MBQ7342156.1 peptidoglycan DD-metalloendopeptidase family protein [Alistipes sp.]
MTLTKHITRTLLLLVATITVTLPAMAQNSKKIAEQQRVIANLEKRIAEDERKIKELKSSKSSTQKRVSLLTRQIESRNHLLNANRKQIRLLNKDINRADSAARKLSSQLEHTKAQYAELVRETYRNYRHNNYLSYIFSSESFTDVVRRITILRNVAMARSAKIKEIDRLNHEVARHRDTLARRQEALNATRRNLNTQKQRLQKDANTARQTVKNLSKQEQQTLRNKIAREEKLEVAINELRRLTKGNKEGASFSKMTSNLNLPVVGGTVRKYKGNMAEIVGRKDAGIISIYAGKVLDIKRNRITNKYDVYVAHGEYISTYANLSEVCVAKDSKVAKNQRIGTIGSSVNLTTMEMEYKMVFGIYSPNPSEVMQASKCFKK